MKYTDWHTLPTVQAGDFYSYPRTVLEAFPNAANHDVSVPYSPMSTTDKVVTAISAAIGLCVILAILKGWL